ncbi:MAG: LysM peptidoglycan-binding domain-containing protein [Verrucomicrobia bacterium]|nr:MAG: LysM peptidoglycan-binding domain-containing protein [Verrucomicrobiota bacterium]
MTQRSNKLPLVTAGLLSATLLYSGCSVAPSKPVKSAGTGAAIGAVGGAIVGNNTGSGNSVQGAAIGALAGAVVGGVVGMVQEAKERSEQDRLAQERAYQQELAKRRAQEAKFRAAIEEELAVAEGFRISEAEIQQVEAQAKELEARLKALQEERNAALARKRALDTAQSRIAAAEAEIQRLEAELADLRGGTVADDVTTAPFVEHHVEQGETILSIATRYQVSVSEIRAMNATIDPNNLVPGQVIKIPVSTPGSAAGL